MKQSPKPETKKETKSLPHSENNTAAKNKILKKPKESTSTQSPDEDDVEEDIELVERIPDEIKFMRRFLSWNNKRKTKEDFLRFINSLQRSIVEKRIRKTSPHKKQINYIQDNLVRVHNTMGKSIPVELNTKTINEFKAIIDSQKVMPSVALIKRYISLNGKFGVKEKARILLEAMKRSMEKGKVKKSDKYYKLFHTMFSNLNTFIKSKVQKILNIEETELSGLNGVLGDCGCKSVNGFGEEFSGLDGTPSPRLVVPARPDIMNSMDFLQLKFQTLGFTGKWLRFIGNPSKGFSAMVFGKPKKGKSILCIDFAAYLARNHGRVLYVAKEEGLEHTLQEKLKAPEIAHPNLDVAESLPDDLSSYDFIFLDSVNKLELSSQDLEILKKNNPGVSFIQIFQTTKAGVHKGDNASQHNVDVVIEVPEKGKAVQFGRFNQGGEMDIFPNDQAAGLEGKASSKKTSKGIMDEWPDAKELNSSDLFLLERVKRHYDSGDMGAAMEAARYAETEVREAIPPDVWLKMGGTLTSTGYEKLRKLQGK